MSSIDHTDVDLVTNLVRRQGEEVLKLRRELEHSKAVNAASIAALSSAEKRIEALQKSTAQWRTRLANMARELAEFEHENDSLSAELDAARAEIRTNIGLSGSPSLVHDAQECPTEATSHEAKNADKDESNVVSEGSESSFTSVSVSGSDNPGFSEPNEVEESPKLSDIGVDFVLESDSSNTSKPGLLSQKFAVSELDSRYSH
ncbi:hypothetical protein GYMLUDRAFT_832460 [Collybiopsis luxurians FD-317 M1]|uniref:Uncharacterized protein n=1 Tax=Collybiopsis luxurians FD-317 M1 TaxID=944289 RepID=A0A0D0CCN3_9AGAR|nr:hypothetical protein GYMLUDRAFT_832460 [Collybiopsis luxurians FD-317 M1]